MTLQRLTQATMLAFSLGLAGAAGAQTTLKVGHASAADSPLGQSMQAFCAQVTKGSKGRYRCAGTGASQGAQAELADALQQGTLDVAHVSAAGLVGKVPEVGIVEVPFLFRDLAHARKALAGPLGKELIAKLQAHKIVGLAWTEQGFRHVSNSQRAVATPADFKGLKLRTQDSAPMQAGFKALGAEVVSLPFEQVYGALEKRTLDGQEHVIATMDSAKFFRVQKHVTLTNHAYVPSLLAVSAATWDKASPADRKLFAAAAAKAAKVHRAAAGREHRQHLAVMKRNGVKVVAKVSQPAFRQAVDSAYADFAKTYGAERLAAVQALK